MSWFSDAFDWIGSFYKDNKDWIQPVVKTAVGAFQQNNKDSAQSQYQQYLQQKEQQNYQNSVDAINAYNAQVAAILGSGGGGGGGGGGAAAAAAAAAARQTEANRMKAAKKANKYMQSVYKKALEAYAPYKATADQLLPQMQKTYEGSLGMQNNLASFVQDPMQMAKLNASIPAWQVNVPLPESVRVK